ncbi:helix-turn-helix domain-containing protein [Enterococcus sp. AZ012]|uniref:helix-turn-helix domain-containing protein n=1 Tax=unclassified Enterococcus TaxID=2608891 RepID=UPI003D2E7158
MFVTFLNKADKRKLVMLQYLENAVALSETKETLMDQLTMSEFLINKTVQELNLDFYELGLNEEFEIVTDGTVIKLNASGLATSDTLLTYYLDQALKFSMLKECFFEQLSSLYEFATNHYLSHNPVYKEFKQFKLILKEYDIEVTKEFQLVGEESEIREFIFLFFMKEYYLNHSPFPKEILEKEKTFDHFNESTWLKPEQSARMRIRKKHYLGIVLARMTNGHYLQNSVENDLVLPKHLVIIEELKRWLQEILTITDQEVLEREARDILRFLIVEGWLIDNNSYIDQEQIYIQQLNEQFIQAVQQQFSLATDTLALLHAETTTIHYQLLSFSFSSRYEYQYMDVTYFLETYPEYAAFCRNYLEESRNRPILWNNKEFLFFRYLILLVSTIPLKEILVPLYVCVDFSFGDSYNQMIKKNIEKILDLNVQFQSYPDDHTHLILSNLPFYGALGIDHILWLAPPRPIDWANFTEKISVIRREQFQTKTAQ